MSGPSDAGNLTVGNVLVGAGELEVDSVNVGYTQGGVTISFERSYLDVDADQEFSAIKQAKTAESCLISTNLLEITLTNIKTVWDVYGTIESGTPAGGNGTEALNFGGYDNEPTEHSLWFTGKGPGGYTRYIEIYKAVSMEAGEHSYKKNEVTVLPVVFKAREDTTKAKGKRLGRIIDLKE